MGGNAGIAQPQPDAAATKPAAHENEKILLKSLTTDMCLGLNTTSDEQPDSGLVKEFGRLSVEGGKSQYVSNKFWVGLSEDVSQQRIPFCSRALPFYVTAISGTVIGYVPTC